MNTAHNIIPFRFENNSIRVVDVDGMPWFIAKDVAEALGYARPIEAVQKHCRDDTSKRRTVTETDTIGRIQEFRIINEPDVLRLIIGCTLPAAERFERWVFEDVLPAILRTGRYEHPHAPPADDAAARQRAIDQKAMELAQATYPVMRGKFGTIADRLSLTTPGVHHVNAEALLHSGLLDMIPVSTTAPAAVPPMHQQMADVLHLRPGEPPAKDRTAAERARRYRARKRAQRECPSHKDDPQ